MGSYHNVWPYLLLPSFPYNRPSIFSSLADSDNEDDDDKHDSSDDGEKEDEEDQKHEHTLVVNFFPENRLRFLNMM